MTNITFLQRVRPVNVFPKRTKFKIQGQHTQTQKQHEVAGTEKDTCTVVKKDLIIETVSAHW